MATMYGGHRDAFLLELIVLGAGALNTSGVRPHEDYADGPAPIRSGPDVVDRMADLLQPYIETKKQS
jgi:hypothetical protein